MKNVNIVNSQGQVVRTFKNAYFIGQRHGIDILEALPEGEHNYREPEELAFVPFHSNFFVEYAK